MPWLYTLNAPPGAMIEDPRTQVSLCPTPRPPPMNPVSAIPHTGLHNTQMKTRIRNKPRTAAEIRSDITRWRAAVVEETHAEGSARETHRPYDIGLRSHEGTLIIIDSRDLDRARNSRPTTRYSSDSNETIVDNIGPSVFLDVLPNMPTQQPEHSFSSLVRYLDPIFGVQLPPPSEKQRSGLPISPPTGSDLPSRPGNGLPIIELETFDDNIVKLFVNLIVDPEAHRYILEMGMKNLFQLYELCLHFGVNPSKSDLVLGWMVWLVEHNLDTDHTVDDSPYFRWSLLILFGRYGKHQLASRVLAIMGPGEFVENIEIYNMVERRWQFPAPDFWQTVLRLPKHWYESLLSTMFVAVYVEETRPEDGGAVLLTAEKWETVVKQFLEDMSPSEGGK
ncbi:hypothetical protein I316_02023 [Kwoniella heveanensis BCC8398]|uniref:Uncharacterized protein n=1 Tax=Kwoniella heveanensis BCC8398 TaxID=1296120 RepID=A0A1B9GYQ0_9TREE|nr:hypothetical protein I316_02023 [Kwoniella heveanensis BCC8398]